MMFGSSWVWLSVGWMWVGSAGFFGLDPDQPIPSLTPYSDVDLANTIAFTKKPVRSWVQRKSKQVFVAVYTDRPSLWTTFRFRAAFQLAKWYFQRCRIDLHTSKIQVLPKDTLTQKGLVQWRLKLSVKKFRQAPHKTFLFLTDKVDYVWGHPAKKIRLLGVSARVWLLGKKKRWRSYPAVWVKMSVVYTTLAHELGHRLGLKHSSAPYRLMLNGAGVRSSAKTLLTSLAGFFAPRRFRFSKKECEMMHQTLAREAALERPKKKKSQLRTFGRVIRILPPK